MPDVSTIIDQWCCRTLAMFASFLLALEMRCAGSSSNWVSPLGHARDVGRVVSINSRTVSQGGYMEGGRRFTPIARSFVLVGLLVFLVFVVLLDGPILDLLLGVRAVVGDGSRAAEFLRYLLAALALVVGVLAFVRARTRERARRDRFLKSSNVVGRIAAQPVFGADPSYPHMEEAMSAVRDKYLDETLSLFATMLIDPSYRVRMSERLTLNRSTVVKSSRAEYSIGRSEREVIAARAMEQGVGAPVIVVPLMPARKGTLMGGLIITDASGNRLSELPQDRLMGVIAIVLRSYFLLTFDGVVEGEGASRRVTDEAKQRLWRLRQIVCYQGIPEAEEFQTAFEEAVDGLRPKGIRELERLKRFCSYFAENYYMACEVPLPAGLSVDVEITSGESVSPTESTGSRMRTFFGMEPHRISVPIDLAEFWPNYHAELDGGDRRQYVYRQQLMDEDDKSSVDEAYLSRPEVDGQLIYQSEPGRINPRINVRNFYSPRYPRLVWTISFDEVPPGAMAPVLALSATTTIFAFCFAFIVPQVNSTEFDASALVVALPLFVLSFFGFSFDKLSRSSLPTVFGFAATSALVIVMAMLVLVSSSDGPGVTVSQSVIGLIPIGGFSWPLLVCALVSLTITINQALITVRRSTRYSAFVGRDDGQQ